MDLARFEVLETYVTTLSSAFAQLQEENQQLGDRVQQLQQTLLVCQRELEQLRSEREELLQLRTKMQALEQERNIIQQKLQQMLSTIEWLEERTRLDGDRQA
jgi:predicted RNase H-like nuclease (RuvC/YqgF family)